MHRESLVDVQTFFATNVYTVTLSRHHQQGSPPRHWDLLQGGLGCHQASPRSWIYLYFDLWINMAGQARLLGIPLHSMSKNIQTFGGLSLSHYQGWCKAKRL